ncbi:LysR family transcriptional regulator [Robbsia sp. KACC 23696]|uniref:LysR family transcriptional regulator n=1 Tax=Robbsia sp. KACC 23696 TaxID=3149231 RepID=UPI00325BC914
MDRLDAIRLFVRLVECGSFSAVGREEGIGQPAVSKQISALERHLGAQLVLRTSRRIAITEAGQTFYDAAKQLVDDADALESLVGERQHSPRGIVRISTAPAHGRLCITPLLPGFFRQYPDVAIDLSVSERSVDLVGDGLDLAVRHGRLVDSSMTARQLGETDFILVASVAYLEENDAPRRLSDLDHHRCVVFAKGRERYPWRLKVGKEVVSYLPHGALVTSDAEHIRAAVLCGLGIAQVPLWLMRDEIRTGQVRILLPTLQPERLPIHLVFPSGRRMPMRVRVFVDYLVSHYAGERSTAGRQIGSPSGIGAKP